MKTLIKILFITIIFFVTPAISQAVPWYVDKSATGLNNGTSWMNAWESFSSIVWGAGGIQPGDIIYISGGSTNKTYMQRLNILVSGSGENNRIYIRPGQVEGHNGIVIIDGQGINDNMIHFNNRSYVTVDGDYKGQRHIRVTNGRNGSDGRNTFLVYSDSSRYITVQNIEVDDSASGIKLNYAEGVKISNNYVHDIYRDGAIKIDGQKRTGYSSNSISNNRIIVNYDSSNSYGPDAIQTQDSVDIFNNYIEGIVGPIYGAQHQDGVQFLGKYIKIYGNYFKNLGNAGIESSTGIGYTSSGYVQIFNNVFENTHNYQIYSRAIEYQVYSTATILVEDVKIWNNTIIDIERWSGIRLLIHSANRQDNWMRNWEVVNNLLVNVGNYWPAIDVTPDPKYTCGNNIVIDNNLIAAGYQGSTQILCNKQNFAQPTGFYDFPSFNQYIRKDEGNNYMLTENDTVAKDNAQVLQDHFTIDFRGAKRPYDVNWDIGAFEFIKDTPRPPQALTIE